MTSLDVVMTPNAQGELRRLHELAAGSRPLDRGLWPIFEGHRPFYLSDDPHLTEVFFDLGLPSAFLSDAPEPMPESIVLFASDFLELPSFAPTLAKMRDSRLFWMPIAAFGGSFEEGLYALRLLLTSDFVKMTGRNRDILSLLASTTGPYVFTGRGSRLVFDLSENVPIASRTRVALSPGESTSLGFYTEVGMSMAVPDLSMPYTANGEFVAEQVLFARQRQSPPELDWLFARGEAAVERVKAELLPLKMTINDSRLDPSCLGALQEVFYWATNADYEWRLAELAFGTNVGIAQSIDWSYNSQFNEGIGGMHIALGDGRTGFHIDFICPGGQLEAPGSGSISGFEVE